MHSAEKKMTILILTISTMVELRHQGKIELGKQMFSLMELNSTELIWLSFRAQINRQLQLWTTEKTIKGQG